MNHSPLQPTGHYKYKVFSALLIPLFLAACGKSSSQKNESISVEQPTGQIPNTVTIAIKIADGNGYSPFFNRGGTVSGVDSVGNGVRDDIDAYISSLPDTPAQKNVLQQSAIAIGNALKVDVTSQDAILEVSAQMSAASWCRHNQYSSVTASRKSAEIERLMINTRPRLLAYEKFNAALSGTASISPQENGCGK